MCLINHQKGGTGLVSEKNKKITSAILIAVGTIILAIDGFYYMMALKNLSYGTIIVLFVGLGIASGGVFIYAATIDSEDNRLKKRIVGYALPVLKSKGEVSLHDIATNLGLELSDVKHRIAGVNENNVVIPGLIEEGYFEDAYLKGGLLVKETPIPCPYCKTKISKNERKCPNCGAAIKK